MTESALAKLLGVSKTPVREALVRLREVGLVRPDGRRGIRVVDLSSGILDDAYEVREALELAGIERTAAAADAVRIAPIEAAANNAMDAAENDDAESFARWDAAFHLEPAGLSGNEHLVKLLRDTLDLIAAIRQGNASQREASPACAVAHLEIVEALHARDVTESTHRLRRHIREGRERSMVEPPTPDPSGSEPVSVLGGVRSAVHETARIHPEQAAYHRVVAREDRVGEGRAIEVVHPLDPPLPEVGKDCPSRPVGCVRRPRMPEAYVEDDSAPTDERQLHLVGELCFDFLPDGSRFQR